MATDARRLSSVELFAGGGGMALGIDRAGFDSLALLELDRDAVATLRHNAERGVGVRPELPIERTDVRAFDYAPLPDEVDLLAAGAPCQPFSLGGNHKGREDNRNLFPEVFRAQRALRPKAVLLENVRGLARPSFRPYLEYLLLHLALPGMRRSDDEDWQSHKSRLLAALGSGESGDVDAYDVWIASVECADFGVPQKRNRVFMVALRHDLAATWTWPDADHDKALLTHAQHVTEEYWDEHEMEKPSVLTDDERCIQVTLPNTTNGASRWLTVRDALAGIPEPLERKPHPYHPNHIGIPGAKIYPGHTGSPLDEPAKTLKAGVHGVPGGENMLRRYDETVRYFTVHEAAVLQTFPPEYEFKGSRTEAMRQIGNAAPVKTVERFASRLQEVLRVGGINNGPQAPHVDLIQTAELTVL